MFGLAWTVKALVVGVVLRPLRWLPALFLCFLVYMAGSEVAKRTPGLGAPVAKVAR